MMPNSPSDTMSAAMLPFRNDGMRSSPNASMVLRPARSRCRPHRMKSMSAMSEIANANGMGETSSVQKSGGESLRHHP